MEARRVRKVVCAASMSSSELEESEESEESEEMEEESSKSSEAFCLPSALADGCSEGESGTCSSAE